MQQAKLKAWRAFETDRFISTDGWDYLRCNVKTCKVETTQQISFTLSAGQFLYQSIKDGSAKVGQYFLRDYLIVEINRQFIRIGCHKVAIKEINRFAYQQGWL
ncbi:hypothetical protein ACFJIV_32275 [Mucilaginibacter sp. UC70_90]